MAYTPTVYTNDASSPDLDATNLNKSEQGIKDAHLIAVPVDCTSRVAEYTGDGIPLIPDNVAGRTYFQDAWATTDGWSGVGASVSVANGRLVIAKTNASQFVTKTFDSDFNPQTCIIRVRVVSGSLFLNRVTMDFRNSSGTYLGSMIFTVPEGGKWVTVDKYYSNTSARTAWIFPGTYENATPAEIEIDFIYIGTGAYDYQNKDRAGNGNSLTLNAVTPVNGKYGKEMSFNGFTAFGVDKSPIVGTSGTLIMRWKRNRVGTAETLISNQSATTDGLRYHIDASNNLYAIIGGSSPVSILIKSGFTDTTSSHTFGIKFSATSATPFYDGVEGTAVSATQVLGLANLAIGRNQIDSTGYASGQGCFRADSRIWSADEVRAWSLNPISIDSRM